MGNRFDDRVRAALALRGVAIDSRGHLALIPFFSGPNGATQEVLDHLNATRQSSATKPLLRQQWTTDFERVIGRVVAGDSTDPDALRVVFFLRLHGLVVDFAAHFRDFRIAEGGSAPTPRSDIWFLAQVLNAIDGLRIQLTEDEQLYAEYRRHVDAHVLQSAYDLQWLPNKNVAKEKYRSKFTGIEYDVQDLNARLDGVIRRYRDELAIAHDFARRLQPQARVLLSAMSAFSGR